MRTFLLLLTLFLPLFVHGAGAPQLIHVAAPLTLVSGLISCPAASGAQSGCLQSSDWTAFNGKAPLASPTFTGTVTSTGTLAVTTSGTSIFLQGGGGGAGDIHFVNPASSGHYNWSNSAQVLTNNAMTWTPSTTVDGSVFSTPVMTLFNTGLLQLTGNIYAAEFQSLAALPASGGTVRLGNSDFISFRNSTNSGDMNFGTEEGGGERFNFTNAILMRKDQNSQTRSIITNANSGSSASAEFSVNSDADELNFTAYSVANGALAQINSGAGFTNGMQIAPSAGPLDLRAGGGQGIIINAADQTLRFPHYSAGIAHLDSSGNLTSSAVVLSGSDVSGNLGVSHLNSGSGATGSTCWHGDGTWGACGGSAIWGAITGTLSAQTDLQTALNLKASLASPTFTGTVTAATANFSGLVTAQIGLTIGTTGGGDDGVLKLQSSGTQGSGATPYIRAFDNAATEMFRIGVSAGTHDMYFTNYDPTGKVIIQTNGNTAVSVSSAGVVNILGLAGSGAVPVFVTNGGDLTTTGTIPAASLPNPSASTLGGIQSKVAVSHQWINSISTSGVPSLTQPAFSDISGQVTNAQLPTAAEYNAGNSGSTPTIDWSNGAVQKITLTANPVLNFSNPVAGSTYLIKVATGAGSFNITWPSSFQWGNSGVPIITATGLRYDLISAYYDGTVYLATYSQGFLTTAPTYANTQSINYGSSNTTSYIDMGNNVLGIARGNAWSISMWVKLANAGTYLISKETSASTGWDLRTDGSSHLQWYSSSNGATNRTQWVDNAVVSTDGSTWLHVVVTYDGTGNFSGYKLYVNGSVRTLTSQFNNAIADWVNSADFEVGGISQDTLGLKGKQNQVSLWNIALTSGNVTTLYNSGTPTDLSLATFYANATNWWWLNQADSPSIFLDHTGVQNGTGVNITSGMFTTDVP